MSGCCSKIPGYYATLGLHISIAFAFAGLLSSTTNMFIFPKLPSCAPGSTSTYSSSSSSSPYCSIDALLSSSFISYDQLGFLGLRRGSIAGGFGFGSERSADFCIRESCDAFGGGGDANLMIKRISNSAGMPSVLEIDDLKNFTSKLTGVADFFLGDSSTLPSAKDATSVNFMNLPVTFTPSTSQSLPAGLSTGTTYYLRPIPSGGYSVATSTSATPLNNIADVLQPGTFSLSSAAFSSCPNQGRKAKFTTGSDGTLQERACGYCLSTSQRIAIAAVPGTTGVAIALLLILAIVMLFPAARKAPWFKAFTLCFSFLSVVFLIVAVSVGYVTIASVLGCVSGISTVVDPSALMQQYKPLPYNSAGQSWGGSVPMMTSFVSLSCITPPPNINAACFNSPIALLPSFGAVYLVVSLLVLFVWALVVAIRIDFALDDAVKSAEN